MKQFTILSILLSVITVQGLQAQDTIQQASVANRLLGVQLGLINLSFQYETKLQRKLTLHTEVGLVMGTSTKEYNNPNIKDEETKLLVPYFSLEPRWYYGLDRRVRKGKNIKNNSSNYFSIQTTYTSYRTPIINTGNFKVVSAFNIMPRFGIRRSFAKRFNYEFSGGYGYQYNIFNEAEGCNCSHYDTTTNIDARIGYNF